MENELAFFDREVRARHSAAVLAGVDEAGRGPLAGPVCCAAVILPADITLEGVNDSKKLTAGKREQLFSVITGAALSYSVVSIDNHVIDDINILAATMRGMVQAVAGLSLLPEYVLIDGDRLPPLSVPAGAVVKGDARSQSIAAASILAKVSRDRLMAEYDGIYPGYGFAAHKGYGTRQHYEAIRTLGLCEIHRRSFLKGLL